MNLLKLSTITMGSLLLLACSTEQTESNVIKTEGIWANIKVESDGERSRVVAELNVSSVGGNNVVLSPQDTLVVSAGGITRTLIKDTDFFDIDYQSYLDVTSSDTLFTIALKRQNETDAANSTVALPASFSIHSPLSTDVFNLDQSIGLDWDGLSTDKSVTLDLVSNCINISGTSIIQTVELTIEDDGQYTVLPGELEMFKNTEVDLSKDCTFHITMTRQNFGQIDNNLKSNSKIMATQYRQVKDIVIDN